MKNQKPNKIIYLVDFLRTVNAGTEKQLGHLLALHPNADISGMVDIFITLIFSHYSFIDNATGLKS